MRITILTIGSRGDVQPYLALAVGLMRSGHTVRLASHAIFENLIRDCGIDFALVRFNPRDIVSHPDVQRAKSNIVKFVLTVRRIIGPQYFDVFDDFWQASQGADAIIASPTASNAYDCARSLRVPLLIGMLQPLIPTREFPSFFMPPVPTIGRTLNKISHHLFNQVLWQSVRTEVNRWRRVRLGLRSAAFFGPYKQMYTAKVPYMVACSPTIFPKPSDWEEWHHLTGYWFLENPSDARPPHEVLQFLESGKPPVYVGFGSMSQDQPERLTQIVIDALEESNQRGILASGWGGLQESALPDSMLLVEDVPHRWLFARLAAIIHHGGAGTTAEGLRSGIPSIVVPFGGDQHHWARILVKAGVSPDVPSIDKLTTSSLAKAIKIATSDPDLRTRASSLAEAIRAEDGVSRAVGIVNEYLT
ncbi:MAG: glycosyltransferase [Candidatus Promineifilaceae bacterium]